MMTYYLPYFMNKVYTFFEIFLQFFNCFHSFHSNKFYNFHTILMMQTLKAKRFEKIGFLGEGQV